MGCERADRAPSGTGPCCGLVGRGDVAAFTRGPAPRGRRRGGLGRAGMAVDGVVRARGPRRWPAWARRWPAWARRVVVGAQRYPWAGRVSVRAGRAGTPLGARSAPAERPGSGPALGGRARGRSRGMAWRRRPSAARCRAGSVYATTRSHALTRSVGARARIQQGHRRPGGTGGRTNVLASRAARHTHDEAGVADPAGQQRIEREQKQKRELPRVRRCERSDNARAPERPLRAAPDSRADDRPTDVLADTNGTSGAASSWASGWIPASRSGPRVPEGSPPPGVASSHGAVPQWFGAGGDTPGPAGRIGARRPGACGGPVDLGGFGCPTHPDRGLVRRIRDASTCPYAACTPVLVSGCRCGFFRWRRAASGRKSRSMSCPSRAVESSSG